MQTAASRAWQHRLAKAVASFLHIEQSAVAFFLNFREGLREGTRFAVRYETLARLSDTELAKRGLTRATITRVILSDDA